MLKKGLIGGFIFLGLILIFLRLISPSLSPDLFWYIKDGEMMVEEGRWANVDSYSFTVSGEEMLRQEWLAEVIIYLIFKHFGFWGVSIFFSIVILIGQLFLYLALRKLGLIGSVALMLTCFNLLVLQAFISVRGQIFSLFFISIFLYLFSLWMIGDKKARWIMAGLIPLWVNLHAGVIGLLIIFCGSLREIIEGRGVLVSLLPSFLGIFLCGIHPDSYTILAYPFWMVLYPPETLSLIEEWKPTNLSLHGNLPLLCLVMALVFFGIREKRKEGVPLMVLCLILLFYSLRLTRMIGFFSPIGIYVLGKKLSEFDLKKFGWIFNLLTFICTVFFGYIILQVKHGEFTFFDWEKGYPKMSCNYIKNHLSGCRIFNEYRWGGYLIYKLYPTTKVFIDGRTDLYWEVLNYYNYTKLAHPDIYPYVFRKYNIDVVLLAQGSPLGFILSRDPNWEKVISTRDELLLKRLK